MAHLDTYTYIYTYTYTYTYTQVNVWDKYFRPSQMNNKQMACLNLYLYLVDYLYL